MFSTSIIVHVKNVRMVFIPLIIPLNISWSIIASRFRWQISLLVTPWSSSWSIRRMYSRSTRLTSLLASTWVSYLVISSRVGGINQCIIFGFNWTCTRRMRITSPPFWCNIKLTHCFRLKITHCNI